MHTTTLSSKGQVVLPRMIRSLLHLTPGTKLKCEVRGDSVILTPETAPAVSQDFMTDSITGLRIRKAPAASEPVTSEMIKALLEDYP